MFRIKLSHFENTQHKLALYIQCNQFQLEWVFVPFYYIPTTFSFAILDFAAISSP